MKLQVAVIGAGVSGLLTARELSREGHHVVVYEKSDHIGGTWAYTPQVDDGDDGGSDNPNRKIVHSSLYYSLRANLPRQLMEFTDYSLGVGNSGGGDQKLYFPSHQEVLEFLKSFATHYGIYEYVELNTEVIRVQKKDDKWAVGLSRNGDDDHYDRLFDAVVVCNGHNSKPRWAHDLPGISKWPGKQIHSHNYRVREPYRDKVVVVIGGGPSAYDIAFDISKVAKEVHISLRDHTIQVGKFDAIPNVWQHFRVENCHENGEVSFQDGALVAADIILHCTGYKYDFPFLRTDGIVSIDDNRVGPLYKHVFPPKLAPSLSFVGIPKLTVSFRSVELQAKWVARVLSKKLSLPSEEEMEREVQLSYQILEDNGVPIHHTHTLPATLHDMRATDCSAISAKTEEIVYTYLDWLAAQVGFPPGEEEHKLLFKRILDCAANIRKTKVISEV